MEKLITYLKSKFDFKDTGTFFITGDLVFPGKEKMSLNLEYLGMNDKSFESIIVAGIWETVVNPNEAIKELCRCAKKTVYIFYDLRNNFSWNAIQIESKADWKEIEIPKGWGVQIETEYKYDFFECVKYFYIGEKYESLF